tara:strand:+ start:162 stop:275 length:114 start_codon:yes stop_codon:yes gene_type:complete
MKNFNLNKNEKSQINGYLIDINKQICHFFDLKEMSWN